MKNTLYKTLILLVTVTLIASCTNDNDDTSTTGKIALKFDNSYGSNDLILDTQTNTTANNEKLKINLVKYIVSNIVLTKEDGTTYTYPKAKSYFIADESTAEGQKFELTDIPAGDYTKVKFGIGVDKEQWLLGATGQGDFLAKADAADLLWSWSAGYKFFAFEGTFTSATVTNPTSFMIHTGQTGTSYNYAEVTLDLPTKALVRGNITPSIHIVTDLSKILDGQNTIKLSDKNMGGMGAMIMGGTILESITANITTMFKVDHVHND
ncbi:MbnP family protein [Flavobacterium eburneipallidum]|uniref:MbnP family protein n=1 Tax=Flavobacterium eburneipallidum TaxID=3003263 RepID=UPI0022AC4BD3|nr:MbnP family protein [Flavobacterium eburneipallidum]